MHGEQGPLVPTRLYRSMQNAGVVLNDFEERQQRRLQLVRLGSANTRGTSAYLLIVDLKIGYVASELLVAALLKLRKHEAERPRNNPAVHVSAVWVTEPGW